MFFLNIGNTHIQCAESNGSTLCEVTEFDTAAALQNIDILTPLQAKPKENCLIASVVPKINQLLVQRYGNDRNIFLNASMIPDIDFSQVDIGTVGADRLANVAAAVAEYSCPFMVIDAGTAVTTEVVDSVGSFRGGMIMPGRSLLRKSLHNFTGQLPLVELQNKLPSPVGRNTKEAILAGVDLGILGALEKIISETRAQLNSEQFKVVIVGGDARFFLNHIPDLTEGDHYFTLRGLLHVARRCDLF